MVMEQLKDAFWEAVTDCLVQFHGFSRTDARARARDRRTDLERVLGNRFEPGIIYHDEPFYIAERLAGRELDVQRHRLEYDAILARRHEDVIRILPWIATIDSFQHWIYTRPGHTRDERAAEWLRLRERFGPSPEHMDYSEFEDFRRHEWHKHVPTRGR